MSNKDSQIGKEEKKERRKHLDDRLNMLLHRSIAIEKELEELRDPRYYRTCIFGSARIKPETAEYDDVFELGRMLAWEGIDILTGGGAGLMEAANKGAKLGQRERDTKSISYGLPIELEWEPEANSHIDIKRHHYKFSSRLDDFMRLSDSVIVTPGGIGTLLELYFSWQLVQVGHLEERPIVLMQRSYWEGVIQWMKDVPLARGYMSAENFDVIHMADTPEEVFEIISDHHKEIRKEQKKVEESAE